MYSVCTLYPPPPTHHSGEQQITRYMGEFLYFCSVRGVGAEFNSFILWGGSWVYKEDFMLRFKPSQHFYLLGCFFLIFIGMFENSFMFGFFGIFVHYLSWPLLLDLLPLLVCKKVNCSHLLLNTKLFVKAIFKFVFPNALYICVQFYTNWL